MRVCDCIYLYTSEFNLNNCSTLVCEDKRIILYPCEVINMKNTSRVLGAAMSPYKNLVVYNRGQP